MKVFQNAFQKGFYQNVCQKTYEPANDTTSKITLAPTNYSDQPRYQSSLVKHFIKLVAKGSWLLHATSKDSDQTGQKPSQI